MLDGTIFLSKIAQSEKLEHKLHYAWLYCANSGIRYNPVDCYSCEPIAAAELIWAHGRYGKRSEILKKTDAIELVCSFLSSKGANA